MTVVNTNVKALIAQQSLTINERSLSKAMVQLSTGKRINGAADDAAGLAIADRMSVQIRSLNQAVRNANDGISMLQTVEGALNNVSGLLQRMRELAIQAANGTNSTANTAALQKEFSELQLEIKRISTNTEWNGMKILGASAATYTMQIGANNAQTLAVTFSDVASNVAMASAVTTGLAINQASALAKIDNAISFIDDFRSGLGAKINRLEYTVDNLTNISVNTTASRSRILDADYAKAASEMARTQIIQQAGTAILAQANTDQQTVLQLLKG